MARFTTHGLRGNYSLHKNLRLLLVGLLFSISMFGLLTVPFTTAHAANNAGVSINNPTVGLGMHVSVNGVGFMPDEQVAVWLTSPAGQTYSYGRVYAYDGTFSSYTNDWADDALIMPGTWRLTAQGITSGTTAYTSFRMLSPSMGVDPAPLGDGMTRLNLNASHWYPGEKVTLWLTDMTGNTLYVGYAWVYRDGSIIDGKSFDVALAGGNYRLSAHGNTSGITTVTSFFTYSS